MDMTYYRFNQEKQARLSFLIGLASVFAVVFRGGLRLLFFLFHVPASLV